MTHHHDEGPNGLTERGSKEGIRPLCIDFDLYTEGDEEYKKELGLLIVANVREFQQSLIDSLDLKDPSIFLKAAHKSKATTGMLEDDELIQLAEALEMEIIQTEKGADFQRKTAQFHEICELIVASLTLEINKSDTLR